MSDPCIEMGKKKGPAERKHCSLTPPFHMARRIGEGHVQCEMKTSEAKMWKWEDQVEHKEERYFLVCLCFCVFVCFSQYPNE